MALGTNLDAEPTSVTAHPERRDTEEWSMTATLQTVYDGHLADGQLEAHGDMKAPEYPDKRPNSGRNVLKRHCRTCQGALGFGHEPPRTYEGWGRTTGYCKLLWEPTKPWDPALDPKYVTLPKYTTSESTLSTTL